MEFRILAGPVAVAPRTADRGRGTPLRVLVVSKNEHAHEAVRSILAGAAWDLHSASGTEGAQQILDGHEFAVVLCDCDVAPGGWIHLLGHPGPKGCPSRMIVFSRLADNALWAEVLNLGGYDLLLYPFEAEELTRVTRIAGENWQREAHRLGIVAPRKPAGNEGKAAALFAGRSRNR